MYRLRAELVEWYLDSRVKLEISRQCRLVICNRYTEILKMIYKKFVMLLTSAEQRQMKFLLLLMVLGMMFEVFGIGLVFPAIALMTQANFIENHQVLKPLLNSLGNPNSSVLIIGGMLALAIIYLLKTIFMIYMVWKQNQFVYGVQASLSGRLFAGYLNQPWRFHLQRNSAQLILNVTNEVNVFISNALQSGMLLLTEGLILFGIVFFLVIVEPISSLVAFGILGGVACCFYRIMQNYTLNWGMARQHYDGLRIQHIQQGLGGIKDVKLLGRESRFFEQYNIPNLGSASVGQKYRTLMELPRLILELLAVFALVGMVLVMMLQNKPIDRLMSVLGLFGAAAFRVMPSLNRIMSNIQNLRYGLPVINTLSTEISLLDDTRLPSKKVERMFKSEIILENIRYQYENVNSFVLKDVTMRISRGTTVGFIGPSGAGKSTLVDIVLGLLTPSRGKILVDGEDIQKDLRGWQDKIGYVPQAIYLTDDSLRRNIAFGLPDELIDEVALSKAIAAAQLEDVIASLSEGIETFVGERGVRLSGGQRQRVGIARALYHDPALLVLDEATSALDFAVEREVMRAVDLLHGKKTVIIITHRPSTISNCDRLYKIEHGYVTEVKDFECVVSPNERAEEPV